MVLFLRRKWEVGRAVQLCFVANREANRLTSAVKISGSVDQTRRLDSYFETLNLTWEKVEVHLRGFWVSYQQIA